MISSPACDVEAMVAFWDLRKFYDSIPLALVRSELNLLRDGKEKIARILLVMEHPWCSRLDKIIPTSPRHEAMASLRVARNTTLLKGLLLCWGWSGPELLPGTS